MTKINFKKIIIYFLAILLVSLFSVYFFKLAPLVIIFLIIAAFLFILTLKKPFFGILLTAFLLPFERIGSFELGSITIRASQIFALLTLVALLLTFFIKKKNFNAKNPLLIPIFLFFGSSIISMVHSPNLERSILIFIFTAFTILISIAIPNLVKSEENLNKITKIILISSFITCLFGIYQFIGDMLGLPYEITGLREQYTQQVFGFPRIHSVALEPLYFANFLLIPISLIFSFLFAKGNKKLPFKIFYLVIILGLVILNLILTLSRGGFLAFGALLFLVTLFFIKSFFSWKKIIIISLIIIFAAVASYNFLLITGKKKNIDIFIKQASTFSKGVSIKERFSTYEQAFSMVSEHPIIGYGIGSFGPYASQSPARQPKEGFAIVNNEFLEIWAEQGTIGLLIFIFLILVIIIRSIKALLKNNCDPYSKATLAGSLIAFLAILVQYQTFSTLYILHFWFLIGLLISVQNIIFENKNRFEKNP